jgi:cell division septum initiation protein DivIVA
VASDESTSRHSLPTSRNGYDRAATDELIRKLESRIVEAQARIADLEQQVREHPARDQELTEALLFVSRVRSESEREAEEIRAQARADAKATVDQAKSKSRGFEQDARETKELAEQARAKLTAFLLALLAKVEPQEAGAVAPSDDLIARASEFAHDAGPEGGPDGSDPSSKRSDGRSPD